MTAVSTLSRTVALAAVLAASSCGGTSEPGPRPARSDLPRALTTEEEQVRASANAFSFALW